MIEDQRQLKITKEWQQKFKATLEALKARPIAETENKRLMQEAEIAGCESQLLDLEEEIVEFESKTGGVVDA